MHTLEQLRSGALAGVRRLDLSCGLASVPPEVLDLADSLEVLNLSDNQLTTLPHDLARLHRLKVIFCSGNAFTHLPEALGACPALEMVGFKTNRIATVPGASLPPTLRWLTLTDNAITAMPSELGERPALQKLLLAGNQLRTLPPSMAGAAQLELVRLAANHLDTLPPWLTELPRLSWLALAGNPLGWDTPAGMGLEPRGGPLPTIAWSQLRVVDLLGEGASGRIYRVQRTGAAEDMALKLFKGQMTSDGLPEHEVAACLAAGPHAALCTPHAVLSDHPDGLRGVLLPLVPPTYINLAAPPSLESCTRDVYAKVLRIPAHHANQLAQTIASAMAHLHQQGLLHGDLYAHNILWNPASGEGVLSDLGAATLLPTAPALRRALQSLDVCAFGVLLQELLTHTLVAVPSHATACLPAMAVLAQECGHAHAAERPTMADVAHRLGAAPCHT